MGLTIPYTRWPLVQPREDTIVKNSKNKPVNANWIGLKYIASSAPTLAEMDDWLDAIFYNSISHIVMLTNFTEKRGWRVHKLADNYIPEIGSSFVFDNIIVYNNGQIVQDNIIYTELILTCQDVTKTVTHIFYQGWPDMNVPDDKDIPLVQNMINYIVSVSGPVLVHCSAGLGRTGVFITAALIKEFGHSKTEALDIVRTSRPSIESRIIGFNMVSNKIQEDWIDNITSTYPKDPVTFQLGILPSGNIIRVSS